MPVSFDTNVQYDRARPQIVESAFQAYCNWAGIHSFKFEDHYAETGRVVNGVGFWNTSLVSAIDVPVNLVLEFSTDSCIGTGVILKYNPSSTTHWIAGISSDGDAEVYQYTGSGYTLIYRTPVSVPSQGDVQVAFRELSMSEGEGDIWHQVSMWINDSLIFTYAQNVEERLDIPEINFGFAVSGNDTITYSDIRIPQLTSFTEWSSLDPGESPIGGLQRTTEGQYVKYYIRYDGSMRAWRSQSTPSVKTFNDDQVEYRSVKFDRRNLYTHVRMLGAYLQAEAYDAELAKKYGHRFKEVNNPFLMTTEDCSEQAGREIQRMEEHATVETMNTSYNPLLEVEDHITTPKGERIITGKNWRFAKGKVAQQITARKYTYGS